MGKYYYICLNCGKTVGRVNKDGNCRSCVLRKIEDDNDWMTEWELEDLEKNLKRRYK